MKTKSHIKSLEYVSNFNLTNPKKKLQEKQTSLNKINEYFNKSLVLFLKQKKNIIKNQIKILTSSSYERWLDKGFVIIKDTNNKLIKKATEIKEKQNININFSDGYAKAKISKIVRNS